MAPFALKLRRGSQGFEDFFDSTCGHAWFSALSLPDHSLMGALLHADGFNVIGPDPRDPTSAVMAPRLERLCSRNGSAPWVRNPSAPQHDAVCKEGTLYQHSSAGVLHYTTDLTPHAAVDPKLKLTPLGVERVGVYRFLDAEIVAFEDGGKLVWRNNDPGPSPKCRCEEPAKPPQPSPPVMLRTYVWAYQWPMANRSGDGGGSAGGGGQQSD